MFSALTEESAARLAKNPITKSIVAIYRMSQKLVLTAFSPKHNELEP
jgi:hypothetical protein